MLREAVMTAVAQMRATGDKAWHPPDGPVLVTNSEDLFPWPPVPSVYRDRWMRRREGQ